MNKKLNKFIYGFGNKNCLIKALIILTNLYIKTPQMIK